MSLIWDHNIQSPLELQPPKHPVYWGSKLEVCRENDIGFKIKKGPSLSQNGSERNEKKEFTTFGLVYQLHQVRRHLCDKTSRWGSFLFELAQVKEEGVGKLFNKCTLLNCSTHKNSQYSFTLTHLFLDTIQKLSDRQCISLRKKICHPLINKFRLMTNWLSK